MLGAMKVSHRSDAQRRGARQGHLAPKMRSQPGQHFGQAEWLGQVVVRAGVEGHDNLEFGRPSGQHHDHRLRQRRPQPPAHRDAVPVGQPEIEQDQIGGRARRLSLRLHGAARHSHLVPVADQRLREFLADIGVVFHHSEVRLIHALERRGR